METTFVFQACVRNYNVFWSDCSLVYRQDGYTSKDALYMCQTWRRILEKQPGVQAMTGRVLFHGLL